MKKAKISKLAILILIIFASITANVALHEAGHYVTADLLNLNPEMHLESPINLTADNQVVTTPNFAYVTYNSTTSLTTIYDALIATSGPLVNAMLAVLSASLYIFYPKKSGLIKYSLIIFLTISVVSLAVNLFPIAPSDGSILFEYLSKPI